MAVIIQFKPRLRRMVVGYLPLPGGGCGRFCGHDVHEVMRLWQAAREKDKRQAQFGVAGRCDARRHLNV